MTVTLAEKVMRFRALHEGSGIFVMPNPHDAGTARILAGLGFKAVATTSVGYAFTAGWRDNTVPRDNMLDHCREIVEATDVPVSADLENGYGHAPEIVAETIRLAAACGLAGASIEDSTQSSDKPLYDITAAAERIRAAAEAARASPSGFVLTARAENFFVGYEDIGDVIVRLQTYQEAGADVLYAPAISRLDDIKSIIASIDRPLNILMGSPGLPLTMEDLRRIGVKRVTVGGALACAALGAVLKAAREILDSSTFGFTETSASYAEIGTFMRPGQQ